MMLLKLSRAGSVQGDLWTAPDFDVVKESDAGDGPPQPSLRHDTLGYAAAGRRGLGSCDGILARRDLYDVLEGVAISVVAVLQKQPCSKPEIRKALA
jgi:hypothetical protein